MNSEVVLINLADLKSDFVKMRNGKKVCTRGYNIIK